MIAIVDYGVGNLFSLQSSLHYLGKQALVSGDPDIIKKCEKIILPGVGAFGDAILKLQQAGLDGLLKEEVRKGKKLLGICLGMQLLFEQSSEYGDHKGLGLIPGKVQPIKSVIPEAYKVPHIGWNALIFPRNKPINPLFQYIKEKDAVYFVHSYYATECEKNVIAYAEYGALLTAAVANENVYGTQFHPEKSGQVGLKILQAFCES